MEVGQSPKIVVKRPGSSGTSTTTQKYREKLTLQTSTGIEFVETAVAITNISDVVLMNGLELERDVDYIINGVKIIFHADLEIVIGDKIIVKYEL